MLAALIAMKSNLKSLSADKSQEAPSVQGVTQPEDAFSFLVVKLGGGHVNPKC